MKEILDFFMDEYLKDNSKLVDSNKDYYNKFINEMPSYLYRYFDENKYLIKASLGAGQKCEIPWICIFNKTVTTSATKGIYICFLFRKDMSGFYLELGQGITTFENLFGKDKYKYISKVATYFRSLIDDGMFSKENIDLIGTNKLAKGYEFGTIISKFYNRNNYSNNELINDIGNLKKIYEDVCENLIDDTYMDIVNNVVYNMEPTLIVAEEANKIIEEAFLEENGVEQAEITMLEQVDIPIYKNKNKYSKITKKTVRKIDYVKKAYSNARNGLLGEELVMEFEKNRLINMGRVDLADRIKWISKIDDFVGYDIISFDVDEQGNVIEKYIEVKSTEANETNVFYVSANEINTMEKLKNKYYIYRVFNLNKKNPLVFVLKYDDFKNRIELCIEGYQARIKN